MHTPLDCYNRLLRRDFQDDCTADHNHDQGAHHVPTHR